MVIFRNAIHEKLPSSLPESIEDYRKYFGPENLFSHDYNWQAFLLVNQEKIIGKAILCWKKMSQTGNLGFIDWENDLEGSAFLIDAIESFAKENGISKIKTPVDLNFFIKYRIKLPNGGDPFWGEPIYPDYYHELFKHTGYEVIGVWDTYRVNKFQAVIDSFYKRKKLAARKDVTHYKSNDKSQRTELRFVKMSEWNSELKIIHSLFVEAYKNMPEWEALSFEQFKVIFDDFKYIVNPYYAYIFELQGKPVAFNINFVDPLPVLLKVKNKKLSTFDKALLFAKQRLNISTFLIAHVGKIPGPNGEEVKGVQIQASKYLQFFGAVMKKVLVTFQMKDSPSMRPFEGMARDLYSQYVLYGKDLK